MGIALTALALAAVNVASATAAPVPALPASKTAAAKAESTQLRTQYDKVPLSFEPNRGQADRTVKFLAHGPRYTLFLTGGTAVLAPASCASQEETGRCWVKMQLLGANPSPAARALQPLPGVSNYFVGSDPHKWRTEIPHFGRVSFQDVYRGISLAYYGNPQHLEYDFEIAPHAAASLIRLKFNGAAGPLPLRASPNGDLQVGLPGGSLVLLKPVAYQLIDGERRLVASQYAIDGEGKVSVKLGRYDHSKELIIDPALVYSTYLGGSGADAISAIAVDGSGNAYVTGGTGSTNFPTSTPEQKSLTGASNAFITELKPDGTGLVFSTYVGGTGYDKGTGIALDPSGNIYVAGYTSSANFPTTSGVFQKSYQGGGNSEAFVLELKAGGATLGYATYLGGSNGDFAYGIAVDSGGNAYLTGSTQSSNFPVANPLQKSLAGGSDAFVTKLDPQGAKLIYSTFLGGSNADAGQAIAIDSAGEAFVTGFTLSADFPTQSPLQGAGGGGDAFVTKLNAAGSALLYSTYLGGSGEDRGLAIAVDGAGDAFVAGSTQSPVFPTTQGAFQTQPGGGTDAFVAEVNPAGSQLIYSTLLGGSGNDQANGIALDPAGNAYVAGSTSSPNFPTVSPSQASLGEGACASTCSNAFVAVVKPGGTGLIYSTYLGGNGPDYGQAITADSSSNAYVAGTTASSTFPATGGVFQGTYAGSGTSGNGFITKISPANVAALALNPQTLKFGNQALGIASSPLTVTLTNAGSTPMSITGFAASDPEFAATANTCNGSLAAGGAQCTVSVTFTPSSTASTTTAITANLAITDSAAGSPQQVALTGTGATPGPGITFSPSPLSFPGTPLVGASVGPLPVTLTNSGTAPLTITAVAISGSFTETNNCVTTLQPGSSCAFQVTFSPTITTGAPSSSSSSTSTSSSTTASNTGAITVTSNFSGTAPTETLTGNSVADFTLNSTGPTGTTLVSATSAAITVGATATLSSFTSSITLSCSSEVTCTFNPTSITPGQTSTMTVSDLTGSSSGVPNPNPVTFTVTGTSSDSNQTATLAESIPLQSFSLSATPAVTDIVAGQSSTYTVTVSSVNGFNLPVSLSCSNGLPANASCTFTPATVTPGPGSPQTSTLTITTTAHTGSSFIAPRAGRRILPPGSGSNPLGNMSRDLILLILLAGLSFAAAIRGRRLAWVMFGLILLLMLLLAGCNQGYYGFVGSNPAPTGSPSGVYTVTISGTYTPASGTTGQAVTTGSTSVNLAVQ
ncbi:MAG TPA: SBBP repeat-containing protein [Terriglobia bacterium]|nr:SBBP repeat-containing protein [Terriglobia bacterium]